MLRTFLSSAYWQPALTVLFLFVCWGPGAAFAQSGTVKGFVTGAEGGEGLVGATVLLETPAGEAEKATTTGEDGFYRLGSIAPGEYVLQVSFVGYQSYRDTLRIIEGETRTESVSLAPTTKELEEVIVEAEGGAGRVEAGKQEVQAADVARIPTPSPSGDIVSYLKSLPGVVSIGDRGGQLYIRGGTPSQNLVLMDGNLVYNPFHLIGFYSVFPDDLISNADFYAGGFGAEYSDRISSVLDVTMRPGNKKSYKASASVSPFVGRLRVEGPIIEDSFSFIASARQSWIRETAPRYLTTDVPLEFNDLYLKLHDTGENSQCALTGLTTADRGRVDPGADRTFEASNLALSGRCALAIPGSSALTTVKSGYSQYKNTIGEMSDPERSASIARGYTDYELSVPYESFDFSYGAKVKFNTYQYEVGEQFGVIGGADDYFFTLSTYTGVEFSPVDWLTLSPSVALVWPTEYSPSIEPRLRAQATPFGDETTINLAAGLYRQTLESISDERDAGNVFSAWVPAPINDRRAQAIHAILGVERELGDYFNLTVEGYSRWMNHIPVPEINALARFTTRTTLADGLSYGTDLRLEYTRSNVYAFVGYGLSVTTYQAPDGDFGRFVDGAIEEYSPPHDQRHRLNAVVEYKLPYLTANVSWQLSTGLPYTRLMGFDSVIDFRELREDPSEDAGRIRSIFDRPYDSRLPVYHRLDVSLSHTIALPGSSLKLQGGAINAYDRDNVFFVDLFEQRRVDQLPVVPYVGIELSIE